MAMRQRVEPGDRVLVRKPTLAFDNGEPVQLNGGDVVSVLANDSTGEWPLQVEMQGGKTAWVGASKVEIMDDVVMSPSGAGAKPAVVEEETSPPALTEATSRYHDQAEVLKKMGLGDGDGVLEALCDSKGDMEAAINLLLSSAMEAGDGPAIVAAATASSKLRRPQHRSASPRHQAASQRVAREES